MAINAKELFCRLKKNWRCVRCFETKFLKLTSFYSNVDPRMKFWSITICYLLRCFGLKKEFNYPFFSLIRSGFSEMLSQLDRIIEEVPYHVTQSTWKKWAMHAKNWMQPGKCQGYDLHYALILWTAACTLQKNRQKAAATTKKFSVFAKTLR